jgi:hypothetical protein
VVEAEGKRRSRCTRAWLGKTTRNRAGNFAGQFRCKEEQGGGLESGPSPRRKIGTSRSSKD